MIKHQFSNEIRTIDWVCPRAPVDMISSEPMIYSGDLMFARNNSGKLTNYILDALVSNDIFKQHFLKNQNIVIDTRITMTMKGMYPSIPGWHCDDVPRSSKYDQPNLNRVDDSVQHFMVLVAEDNGNRDKQVSNTEFVTENVEIDVDENNVWNSVDSHIESHPEIKTSKIRNGEIIRFTQNVIHRAGKCVVPGWRMFFRLSLTHREPVNKIRNQVQVYVDSNGWQHP